MSKRRNHESGITNSEPDFDNLLFTVIKKAKGLDYVSILLVILYNHFNERL
jgi:hypothetical protein